ncbi:MAG TPA: helix-turn-helix transcriptional regulator [Cyclobacteriaceae bacterium]|nr:helix-turn-helix transcriptional regulator [Cyclobacteriaceae bacterium]
MIASKGLMAATTKSMILSILKEGKNYGYNIIQRVKKISGGSLNWSDGMLYPVLHRLEKEGFITSEWIVGDLDRKRKYYSITEAGKAELLAEKESWITVHTILSQLWDLNPLYNVRT